VMAATAVAGAVPNLFATTLVARRLAVVRTVLALAAAAVALTQLQMTVATVTELRSRATTYLDALAEASGGATIGNRLFVIDDEHPEVFEFKYEGGDRYTLVGKRVLERRGTSGALTELTKHDLDDIEGAAAAPDGTLYLVTSHANTRTEGESKTRRERIVRVADERDAGGTLHAVADFLTRDLQHALLEQLQGLASAHREGPVDEGLHIEGMALDSQLRLYLGLRAPVTLQGHAIVLRTALEQLGSGTPQWEVLQLRVSNPTDRRQGIISMEYDTVTKAMLLVTAGTSRHDNAPAQLWWWDVEGTSPQLCGEVRAPEGHGRYRPEALFAPTLGREQPIAFFIDYDNDVPERSAYSQKRSELQRRPCGLALRTTGLASPAAQ